jgi:hypothetical protein
MSVSVPHSSPFLDTIWARLIAAAIAVAGIALFLGVNWDRVQSWRQGASAGAAADRQCIEERMAAIAALEAEAGLSRKQVELHRERAAAFCQQQLTQ